MLTKITYLTLLLLLLPLYGATQDVSHEPGIYKFLENKNQWPEKINFRATLNAGNIWLEKGGILYQFTDYSDLHHAGIEMKLEGQPKVPQHLVFAEFVGANEEYGISKKYETSEYYNFFIGNDKSKWASNVRGYNHIEYEGLYDNINLKLFETEGQLKYEYTVLPGGNPDDIIIQYYGHDKIRRNRAGEIVIETSIGQIIEEKPYVFQIKNGKIIEIESEFLLTNDQLSFSLGSYDESYPLIIDPILVFATYSGSPTDNFGMTGTYAYNGDGYSGGTIYGNQYPIPLGTAWNTLPTFNTLEGPTYGITDVFLSKYSSDGTQMLWTNFVGGGDVLNGTETVHSLICDTLNNIYLYGATSSLDFPMQNAYQNTHGGGVPGGNFLQNGVYYTNQGTDIYVTKISSDGMTLLGSTFVGGSSNDGINYNVSSYANSYSSIGFYDSLTANYGDQFRGEIMLDSAFNVMIASSSRSTNFPVMNSFQGTIGGQQDAVLFKLSNDLSTMMWSTFYGGTENDAGYSVKIDSSYNIILAGGTSSNNLAGTTGGLYPTNQGGDADGYVVKITPDGSTITQATYFGTSTYDQVYFTEIDRWDNIYIYGQTDGNTPTINAPYSVPNSGQFITKLSPDLTSITYSTKVGNGDGNPDISPSAFLVDVCGNVYISGWGGIILGGGTPITGLPTTTNGFQTSSGDGYNFYLFVLERDAQSMLYGSYLGGGISKEHVDGGTSRFDKFGVIYQSVCGGCWGNSDFPTTPGAWSSVNLDTGGAQPGCNNLLFKFDFEIVPDAEFAISDLEGCAPFTFILDNESNDTINSVWTFPPEAIILQGGINPQILFEAPGTYNIILSITDTICNLQDTALKVINVYDSLVMNIRNDTVLCNAQAVNIWAGSFGTGNSFDWYDDPGLTNQINLGGMDSSITVNPTTTTTYYVEVSNGWPLCNKIDSVTIVLADGAMGLLDSDTLCAGDTLMIAAQNLLPSETMTFSWSPTADIIQDNDSIIWINPQPPGVSQYYYVTGTTGSGCVFTDSIWINVNWIDPNSVYATATPDSIPEGGSTVLEAFPNVPGYTYIWSPPFGLSSPIGQTVTASGLESDAAYLVTILGSGCQQKTQVIVYVLEFVCGDIYIFVPNAFTPDGNGENDEVFVRGQNLTEINFKIFDRWGELVFETTDQSQGWDGTFKGKLLDPDVYVYHLTAICFDGQEALIKGNITLLK
jgi:gliding motility-associated-like protein